MQRFLSFGVILFIATVSPHSMGQPSQNLQNLRQNALALEQQGKADEAEAAWRSLSKVRPADPEPYAQIAVLEARQQHYSEAIPLYRKALAINPNTPGLRLNLALALFKAGDLKAAIPEFEAVRRKAAPGSPEAQRCTVLIGMSWYGLAEYPKAAPFLKDAADQDPNNLPLLLALAHSYLWSREFQRVLDVYHQILVLNPDSAEADMLAGEALDEMKDNEGSTKMFRAAVQANPKEPNVHFGLGYLLWTQKQYPEAIKEFQAELANDPNHVQSMLYMADAKIQLNQSADVEPLLRKVIELNPSFPLAHLDLGIILADADHNDAALKEFLQAEKLNPNDVDVHWRLGRLYRAMGRKQEAVAELDKANSLNKQADEDLYKKIAAGSEHHQQEQSTQPAAKQP